MVGPKVPLLALEGGSLCLMLAERLPPADHPAMLHCLCTPCPPLPGALHPLVSAWVLDKRELTQTEELYGGGHHGSLARPSQRRLEAFIEQCRHDVQVRRCTAFLGTFNSV